MIDEQGRRLALQVAEDIRVDRWAALAAARLYGELGRLEGEAMNDAQVAQDPEAGEWTWVVEAAKIIAAAFDEDYDPPGYW